MIGWAAERKAEAAEQKVAQLEARLREHRSQTAEQFQKIRDSTMTDVAGNLIHQLQAQLEDFKDRQAEALRAGAQNAASLASLEAGLETWRQRLDGAFQEPGVHSLDLDLDLEIKVGFFGG
ncbi:unnamed protein product [Effrenium voratum]|uniref:Uncharacterized protein n=1 Tax=Effrenium voratum TaxID=2562239 RepID=A0AA36JHV3_9DINO|nr:unnamed protein product [Effrenium voratum]